jgi:hypothetical protein
MPDDGWSPSNDATDARPRRQVNTDTIGLIGRRDSHEEVYPSNPDLTSHI